MRFGRRMGDIVLEDQLVISCPYTGVARAVQASDEAERYGFGRHAQDEWAVRSHERAAAAQRGAVRRGDRDCRRSIAGSAPVDRDESIRPDTTLARLAALRPSTAASTSPPATPPGSSTGSAFAVLRSRRATPTSTMLSVWRRSSPRRRSPATPPTSPRFPAKAVRPPCVRAGRSSTTTSTCSRSQEKRRSLRCRWCTTLLLADGDDARADKRCRARTNVNGGPSRRTPDRCHRSAHVDGGGPTSCAGVVAVVPSSPCAAGSAKGRRGDRGRTIGGDR